MVKHLRFSYADVRRMPVYERRYFIGEFQRELDQQKAEQDKQERKMKSRR